MHSPQDTLQSIERFSVLNRILHIVVMLGFIGLGLTGFSLYFGGAFWARAVAWVFGGAGGLAWLHRACAVVTYAAVMAHVIWLFYFKLVLKGSVTGPHTMFPSTQDVSHLFKHIAWMLGKSPLPEFNRFAYWEKVDYWAVFVGMNTMGATGLVLWFPEWFTLWLPGWVINLAMILHLFEAIIAVALKFVTHVVIAHLRPEIWPADTTIFHGRMSIERVKHEHPAQWQAMQAGQGEEG